MRLPFSPVELCVTESIFCFVHLKPLVWSTHRVCTAHLLSSIFGQFRQIYPDYVTILSEVVSALERQFVLKYMCACVCVFCPISRHFHWDNLPLSHTLLLFAALNPHTLFGLCCCAEENSRGSRGSQNLFRFWTWMSQHCGKTDN